MNSLRLYFLPRHRLILFSLRLIRAFIAFLEGKHPLAWSFSVACSFSSQHLPLSTVNWTRAHTHIHTYSFFGYEFAPTNKLLASANVGMWYPVSKNHCIAKTIISIHSPLLFCFLVLLSNFEILIILMCNQCLPLLLQVVSRRIIHVNSSQYRMGSIHTIFTIIIDAEVLGYYVINANHDTHLIFEQALDGKEPNHSAVISILSMCKISIFNYPLKIFFMNMGCWQLLFTEMWNRIISYVNIVVIFLQCVFSPFLWNIQNIIYKYWCFFCWYFHYKSQLCDLKKVVIASHNAKDRYHIQYSRKTVPQV